MKNTNNNTTTNLQTNLKNEGENNMKTLTKKQKIENFEKSYEEKQDEIYNKIEDAIRDTFNNTNIEVRTYLTIENDGTISDVWNSDFCKNSNSYYNNKNYFVFHTEQYETSCEDLVDSICDNYREENGYKEEIEKELRKEIEEEEDVFLKEELESNFYDTLREKLYDIEVPSDYVEECYINSIDIGDIIDIDYEDLLQSLEYRFKDDDEEE